MHSKRKPRFKTCRRLGLNVVGHPKAMDRYTRGVGRADRKLSNYGEQLLEKQRLRAYYNIGEKQMSRYAKEAMASDERTNLALIDRLERRLDNLVYRAGIASSIRQARQLVVHGHITVDGRKVDRPSYRVAVGETIALTEKMASGSLFAEQLKNSTPVISALEKEGGEVVLTRRPDRNELPIEVNDHLVVEFYSKRG